MFARSTGRHGDRQVQDGESNRYSYGQSEIAKLTLDSTGKDGQKRRANNGTGSDEQWVR
jgi:hypothetical protein